MTFEELSEARYSLRKFSDRPIEAEKLELVLKAARTAPTAHNNQPQHVFVLKSAQALEKADTCTGCHFHPPVMLVVAYDAETAWKRTEYDGKNHGEIDAAITAAQMMLQAADIGLAPPMWEFLNPRRCWNSSRRWRAILPSRCCPLDIRRRAPMRPASILPANPWKSFTQSFKRRTSDMAQRN